jgi:transketolase
VQLAIAAHERLAAEGVRSRVVNMASFALFARQDGDYRESVLPPSCSTRLGIEAAASFGWERWLGDGGEMIAIDRFGASAPAGTIFEKLGFTADNVYAKAKALLG